MKRVTGASFPSSLVQIIELTGQACLGPGAAKMPTVLSVLLAAKEPADQAPGGALPGPPPSSCLPGPHLHWFSGSLAAPRTPHHVGPPPSPPGLPGCVRKALLTAAGGAVGGRWQLRGQAWPLVPPRGDS